MKGGIVGRRYAKALLNLTASNKEIEKTGHQLEQVAILFQENIDLRNVMHDPKISKSQKIAIIDKVTKKLKCSTLVNKYCRFITSRNRFGIVADISSAYVTLANNKLGKATANVVVAFELTSKEEKKLQKQLSEYTGKKLTLNVEVDESILGGAITSIESLVLDGSIQNRLNLISETISKGN